MKNIVTKAEMRWTLRERRCHMSTIVSATKIKSHQIFTRSEAESIFWSLWCRSGAGCSNDNDCESRTNRRKKRIRKNDLVFCSLWFMVNPLLFLRSVWRSADANGLHNRALYTVFNLQFVLGPFSRSDIYVQIKPLREAIRSREVEN